MRLTCCTEEEFSNYRLITLAKRWRILKSALLFELMNKMNAKGFVGARQLG